MSPAWQSYEQFVSDMGERPLGTSLDRIDVNGDYTPDNCRWATTAQQANNRTNNHYVVYEGARRTVYEWGQFLGIKPNTLIYRLRRGWSVSRAFSKRTTK